MGDSVDVTPKKSKATKSKKPKTAPTHPKVADMVNSAILTLKERGGSSLQAIKKYVSATYKVDAEKLSPFIKKYLKSAVASGGLVQTKGKGATGSFRIGGTAGAEKKAKSAAKPKKAAVKSPKPKKAKPATPKKAAAKPKKQAAKKTKSPAKKAAKPAAKKSPVKKPKAVKLATKAKKPKATPKKAAKKGGKK